MSTFLFIILLIVALYYFWLFVFPLLRGGPYVPSNREIVERMIRMAGVRPGEKAVDLGSGDGRVVIALARAGAEAYGFEINPFLVSWSRRNIKKAGLEGKAFIIKRSFWKENYSKYQIVTVFEAPYILGALKKKLLGELPIGARVVANAFPLPKWKSAKEDSGVYLYIKI